MIYERVPLATGSWVRWMGVASVFRLACVRWVVGLSMIMSAMSGGGLMSNIGVDLGVVTEYKDSIWNKSSI